MVYTNGRHLGKGCLRLMWGSACVGACWVVTVWGQSLLGARGGLPAA
jgi:hypothetical protein